MKPRDDPVQRLLGEIERLRQVGAFDPRRLPDQPQQVALVAGSNAHRLCVSQEMRANMV
jgi:hypothetical protein